MADEMHFDDLPEEVRDGRLRRLAEIVAVDRESSHVSSETWILIREDVAALREEQGDGPLPTAKLAARIVARLDGEGLREIVSDWLERQAVL